MRSIHPPCNPEPPTTGTDSRSTCPDRGELSRRARSPIGSGVLVVLGEAPRGRGTRLPVRGAANTDAVSRSPRPVEAREPCPAAWHRVHSAATPASCSARRPCRPGCARTGTRALAVHRNRRENRFQGSRAATAARRKQGCSRHPGWSPSVSSPSDRHRSTSARTPCADRNRWATTRPPATTAGHRYGCPMPPAARYEGADGPRCGCRRRFPALLRQYPPTVRASCSAIFESFVKAASI
jgi:hypothetical protein